MATVITLPAIHGLDKEKCFPKGRERLWNYFSVDNYNVKHSKIFRPHLFMPTNEFNLSYQKMIPKFEFIRDIEPDLPCDPLCQEGWYFDCETETCKEYSSYIDILYSTTTEQIPISLSFFNEFSNVSNVNLDAETWYLDPGTYSYLTYVSYIGATGLHSEPFVVFKKIVFAQGYPQYYYGSYPSNITTYRSLLGSELEISSTEELNVNFQTELDNFTASHRVSSKIEINTISNSGSNITKESMQPVYATYTGITSYNGTESLPIASGRYGVSDFRDDVITEANRLKIVYSTEIKLNYRRVYYVNN